MPIIIAVHIAKSSARWLPFHTRVIIQAEGPVMSPYMSRAIGTIQAQQAPATSSSEPSTSQRSRMTACSSDVLGADDATRRPVHARQVRVGGREVERDLAGCAGRPGGELGVGELEAGRQGDARPLRRA